MCVGFRKTVADWHPIHGEETAVVGKLLAGVGLAYPGEEHDLLHKQTALRFKMTDRRVHLPLPA